MLTRRMKFVAPGYRWAAVVLVLAFLLPACRSQQECVDKSKKPLEECRLQVDSLQSEILTTKRLLAQCQAVPGKITTEEVEVDGQVDKAPPPKEGSLTQEEVVGTIQRNKAQLKQCYERAMKKSVRLQQQKTTVTLAFKIRSTGEAVDVAITPNYDFTMTDCMKKAIRRWKFPTFTGQPVDVETPFTLSPKR